MKIAAPRSVLAPALSFIYDIVPARTPMPILSSIVAETGDGRVKFRATDLDCDLYAAVAVDPTLDLDENGSCVIDARLAALDGLRTAEVVISVDGDTVTLRSGRSRYKLPVLPIEDFPAPLAARFTDEPSCTFALSAADAIELVRPLFAASDETTRYYLCGIHIHRDADSITSVATDGHSLCRVTLPSPVLTGAWPNTSVIVATRACEIVAKLAKDCNPDDLITFRTSAARIDCAANGRGITSKLIDGTFPDYRRVIPHSTTASAHIDAEALIKALGRLAAVAGDAAKTQIAGIAWGDGDTAVTLSLPRAAETAEDIIDAATSGATSFVVSTSKLRELVSKITGKTVTSRVFTKEEPIVVIDAGDTGYYSLVMPMRV